MAVKIVKYMMIILLSLIVLIAISTFFYMRMAKFGKAPSGDRLIRMAQSPNFKNGVFQNISLTPTLVEGYSMFGLLYRQIFDKVPRVSPTDIIPSVKTDLRHLPLDRDVLVWFGHSSYFMQVDGKRYLVDPVFSGNASPIPGTVKAFKGTDIYTVSDLPDIDYLLISHDHYDHLDYETILALKEKISHVVCGLGVGSHFEYWGYPAEKIIEKDWNEELELDNGAMLYTLPARHQSGRGFTKNNTLWMSFILKTPALTVFIGGDSGYDKHFAAIGNKFGPIDLAILENGQYNEAWRYIHTLPEEVLLAAADLKAKRIFPVHSSKFALGRHSWDTPLIELTKLNKGHIPLVTPIIGQVVYLDDAQQEFKQWWTGLN